MSNPQQNQLSQERNMFVTFYTDAVELTYESEQQGRPIFKDVPFVKIIVPGDMNNVIERVADENDKLKYPNAWARFVAQEAEAIEGTPLEQWPQITRSLLKECKYFEVHTVEQLAGLSDSHLSRMGMGFQELRRKAQAWLQAAEGTAATTAQAAENEKLRSMIDDLQAQIKDMGAKKAGRPPKEMAEA